MSSMSFWKNPRSNRHAALQWGRRVVLALPFVLQEVNERMLNRAQIMRPVEGGVVHQGWLHPDALAGVRLLFAGRSLAVLAAQPIELPPEETERAADSFLAKLWPGRSSKLKVDRSLVVQAGQSLPFSDASQAMVWSPLWLHGVEDPTYQLSEWLRILKPEGGVFFSCFGPDTAKELHAFARHLGVSFPDFADMHDWGDLMSKHGFSDPVMEMEKLTLTYADAGKLLADWRALAGNVLAEKSPGLLGKAAYQQALDALNAQRDPDSGRLSLTLELVYGHAWKVNRKPRGDVSAVKISDIGGRRSSNK